MSYAELACQSNFSFLIGASHPEEYVTTASFLGYQAIAITDECSVAGVVRAYSEIKRQNLPIQLIVGSLFHFHEHFSFVLLCPNKAAYSELCRIITSARRRCEKGHYELAEWDIKTIRHCFLIWLPSLNEEANTHWASWLMKHFEGRCWIGVSRLLDGKDEDRFFHANRLTAEYSLPVCAVGQVLFHHTDRQKIQHILHAIREGQTVASLGLSALANAERCLRPLNKLQRLYPSQWLQETLNIAKHCHFSLNELRYQYPAELVPEGKSAQSYLRECVENGIKKRFPEGVSQEIRAIIEKELTLIAEQQYAYFFLTIYDIVKFAQQQHILYQGRGSAANSVVCYCLEITAVDPRQINVLFERFISKERNEPPDIDVDFEHERREEVIQYIYQKYGRERTALAATVISFRFKSAFREVGKALGYEESQLSFWLNQVNRRDRALGWKQQLIDAGLHTTNAKAKLLFELVNEILGFPRHLSQHVGGFVISSGPLYELVPVENAAMAERTVIQWDKDDIESLGLLKVDVLALGMLTAIRKAFHLIKQHKNFTLSLPFITKLGDDKQVYKMITNADTVGVFQIESRAQMSMLPRLKPNCYYDLVVQIAIVRPGPIQGDMVHPYLLRRHGKEAIQYPSEAVKSVLNRTMGVPIFQEQVIQLAMVAAGFTGGEADQLRRAMASWKKTGELQKFKHKLISGMTKKGYDEAFAQRLYDQICGFGEYGFPESHSASFAVLAYASAWLKYYFPTEFFTALLNSLPMGFYSASQLVQDAKRHDVSILPVCINHSNWDHIIENDLSIRLGFRQIKGFSQESADKIIAYRENGLFSCISDIHQISIPNDHKEALASAEAFASLTAHRFSARWQLMDKQQSLPLFDNAQAHTQSTMQPPTQVEALKEDYHSLSLSLKHHPISLLQQAGKLSGICFFSDLHTRPNKSIVKVVGCVTGRQAPGTASGVTFVTLEDPTGNINVVVWQATAREQKRAFLKSTVLQVNGVLERSPEGVIHVIAGKLIDRSHELHELHLVSRDFH